jgi:hypothetical protein
MAVMQSKPAKLALIGAALIGVALPAVAAAQWHQRGDGDRSEEHRGGGNGSGGRQAPQSTQPRPAPAPQVQQGWSQRPVSPPPQVAPAPGWNNRGNWAGRPVLPAPQAAPAPAQVPNTVPSPRAWGYAQRGTVPPPQPGRDRNDWVNRGTAAVPQYAARGRDHWREADNRRWDHDWRRDNHYDWRGWREGHRDWFHLGRYYPPYQSWYYRRLSVGFVLDALFWGDHYWIADPFYYHLPPAYGPYRWVRYYDDALLVDTYTGQVVDVIYGVFW